MTCHKFWGVFAFIVVASILAGCSAKPYAELFLKPVADGVNAQVDAGTGSITVQQQGVRITLKPLDEVELFNLTKDPDINPYINVNFWGSVELLYTVVEIHIENIDNKRSTIYLAAVLVDENGEQYAALSYDDFKALYAGAPSRTTFLYVGDGYSQRRSHYLNSYHYGYTYPLYRRRRCYFYAYDDPYPNNRRYHSHSLSRHGKQAVQVAHKTVFDGGTLRSSASRTGLVVFDRIDAAVTDVKVIIPQVLIIDKNDQKSTVDFTFNLRQVDRREIPRSGGVTVKE